MIPSAMSWAGRALRLPLQLVPPMRPFPVLSGPLKGKRWLSTSASHGCWLGTYERGLQESLARTIKPGMVFYDIGANAGFFSLLGSVLAGPTGQVVAIEPLPRNVDVLKRHIELNRAQNILVIGHALADAPGELRFEEGPSHSMGRLHEGGTITVAVSTLDELVRTSGARPPDVIKMDIEGAEERALEGGRQTFATWRPVLFLSTHGYAQHNACIALLHEYGYETLLRRDGAADGQYELLATPLQQARG